MTRDKCIEAAKKEAKKERVTLAIVHDPLSVRSHDEFGEGEYGFAPPGRACEILYKWGAIVAYVAPDGSISENKEPYPITSAANYAISCGK